jgi:two-component system, NarL family, nitrate/nitrite response regulator NarL
MLTERDKDRFSAANPKTAHHAFTPRLFRVRSSHSGNVNAAIDGRSFPGLREMHMRILLVDDQPILCESLSQLLELRAEQICHRPVSVTSVYTLADAITVVQSPNDTERPDIVFLDLNLDGTNRGLVTLDTFRNSNLHNIPVVIFSGITLQGSGSSTILRKCLNDPCVTGILLKNTEIRKAFVGLERILAGETWFPIEVLRILNDLEDPRKGIPLAPHEWRVAEQMCLGHRTKVMAYNLELSENHVRNVCGEIFKKLGVNNRVSAVNILRDAVSATGN